jgi:hypothetical protein
MAGYSIFAHSRAIALARLLPLYIINIFLDYRQKNPLKYYIPPFIAVYRFMVNLITKKEMLTKQTILLLSYTEDGIFSEVKNSEVDF